MNRYVVGRVVGDSGLFRPSPYVLGDVEIYPSSCDTPAEKDAIDSSLKSWTETAVVGMRMRVVLEGSDPAQAHRTAEDRFDEALDILDFNGTGLSQFALLNAGYTRDLSSGAVAPRDVVKRFGPFPSFQVVTAKYSAMDVSQYLLLEPKSDLASRLIRSFHWTRKARWEKDFQLRVLFRWFALEAIWMIARNDDIVPRILWGIGFPNGKGQRFVDAKLLKKLAAHPRYRTWRGEIKSRFEAIRSFRNNSLHNGFRHFDLPRKELEAMEHLLSLVCPRVQAMARIGVVANVKTIQQLLEYLPLVFEENSNIVNDVHNIVIYTLENPSSI